MQKRFKIVVYVPETYGDVLREAMAHAGAGAIGNYTHCTFSVKGIGRFKPGVGTHPTIGEVGKIEAVEEERIETVCTDDTLDAVLEAIRKVHPYEEPATDVYLLETIP